MINENGNNLDHDTGEMDIQEMILSELQAIRGDLDRINWRIEQVEQRIEKIVTDLSMIHAFQQSYSTRLSSVENLCASEPLRVKSLASYSSGDNESGSDRIKP